MSAYACRSLTDSEYRDIIKYIREGYCDHRPNPQIATILVLEANLGCRIGDILKLRTDSFINDGGIWKLNIVEQKTGKSRNFIVPKAVKEFIDRWIETQAITTGKLFNVTGQAVWKALRQVTDFLELKDVSSHSFRKYIARNIYESTGHDIDAVRRFLQHSSVTITQAYLGLTDTQLESAISNSVNII